MGKHLWLLLAAGCFFLARSPAASPPSPGTSAAYSSLGQASWKSGDKASARYYLSAACEMVPAECEVWGALEFLAGNYRTAIALYETSCRRGATSACAEPKRIRRIYEGLRTGRKSAGGVSFRASGFDCSTAKGATVCKFDVKVKGVPPIRAAWFGVDTFPAAGSTFRELEPVAARLDCGAKRKKNPLRRSLIDGVPWLDVRCEGSDGSSRYLTTILRPGTDRASMVVVSLNYLKHPSLKGIDRIMADVAESLHVLPEEDGSPGVSDPLKLTKLGRSQRAELAVTYDIGDVAVPSLAHATYKIGTDRSGKPRKILVTRGERSAVLLVFDKTGRPQGLFKLE